MLVRSESGRKRENIAFPTVTKKTLKRRRAVSESTRKVIGIGRIGRFCSGTISPHLPLPIAYRCLLRERKEKKRYVFSFSDLRRVRTTWFSNGIAAFYIVILATDFAAVLSISADINNDIYWLLLYQFHDTVLLQCKRRTIISRYRKQRKSIL